MKIARRIFISLSIALLVVCCGAVLLFNWSVTGWKALTVPTSSMRPTIPQGSLVLMHSVPMKSLKVGDVITYANLQKPGTTITHRIIKTYKINGKIPAFVTQGDANSTADRPIVGGLVQGKAAWHVPSVGAWLSWAKGPIGLLVLIYVPALFIMFEEVQRLAEYYRKSRPYLLRKFEPVQESGGFIGKLATSAKFSIIITALVIGIGGSVQALLRSNTVSLAPNRITVAKITHPCTGNSTTVTINGNGGHNTNNVNVSNNNSQNAHSGNATSSGNTNSGNVTSGNASNTNCTSTTIIQTNHSK